MAGGFKISGDMKLSLSCNYMGYAISAIVSGASGAGSARKTDSPAQDSMAADAFYYDVRSMPESDSPEPRTDIKKEAASRKVTSILVLYSDGSFETFAPA